MTKIYSAAQFREAYGEYFKASSGSVDFDVKDVPAGVAALIPYARFWGIEDDGEVEDLLNTIPVHLQRNFRDAVYSFDDAMDEWLAAPRAGGDDDPCHAYVAFSAMRIAADSVVLPD